MNLSGSHVDYLIAFFGGIILSFTPCVYPLIPISAGYIGIRAGGSKLKGFVLSLLYVTGTSVTYSLLGLCASLSGKIFGAISAHPITYILAGIAIIIFGVSMFDVFEIPLLNIVKLSHTQSQGYFSAFLLGLSSGLVISPCLSPVLGTILLYLATKKHILYGMTLLFTFAYGMGLVLILVGTFSAILLALPASGKWMVYIKKLSALVLIGMGIYFIFMGITRL